MRAMPVQTSAKHTPCASVNASPKNVTAKTSAMVGLTYCRKPMMTMGTRFAAAEYSSRGMAVSTPAKTIKNILSGS